MTGVIVTDLLGQPQHRVRATATLITHYLTQVTRVGRAQLQLDQHPIAVHVQLEVRTQPANVGSRLHVVDRATQYRLQQRCVLQQMALPRQLRPERLG